MKDSKGRLDFSFVDLKDVTFQVTTKGKLGVYYPESLSVRKCLQKVEDLLVKPDGEAANIIEKIYEFSASTRNKVVIVKVSIVRSCVVIPKVVSFEVEASLKNNLKTSVIVEKASIKTDGPPIINEMWESIPAGETRRISLIPCSSRLFGKTWIEGGKVKLSIIHTYGETSISFKVPPLDDKELPYTLFQDLDAWKKN